MGTEEYRKIDERLSRIEKITLIGSKNVLTLSEAALVTGLSKNNIYRLTSERKIPFYKPRGGALYFEKTELEEWLLQGRVETKQDIESQATTYVAINR